MLEAPVHYSPQKDLFNLLVSDTCHSLLCAGSYSHVQIIERRNAKGSQTHGMVAHDWHQ